MLDKNTFRTARLRRKNLLDEATVRELVWLVLNDFGSVADETNALIAVDVNLQAQIDALVAGDIYDEITAAALLAKRTGSTLVPAKAYKITDLAEPLIVYAIATNKIGFRAYSPSYPQDIIIFNTADALTANWYIAYREDTINRLSIEGSNADFRATPVFGANTTNCRIRQYSANGITIGTGCSEIDISLSQFVSGAFKTLAIGNDCLDIRIRGWYNQNITIGDTCSDLDIDALQLEENLTVPASTIGKRVVEGYSNFESASIDINGLSTINLTGKKHCGIINLISSSDSDTEQIDIISNASDNHPITLKSTDTLTINYRDLGISGGNLKLESSPTTVLGDRHDFITFEKDGSNMNLVNVRNYLPILVSP